MEIDREIWGGGGKCYVSLAQHSPQFPKSPPQRKDFGRQDFYRDLPGNLPMKALVMVSANITDSSNHGSPNCKRELVPIRKEL